ncbi:MAG: hypothetical protein Tsb002_31830 [Wenzhouxiangellaceae bacterium]
MANNEHLAILKQGREVWNQWRLDNPELRPDLSNVDFTRAADFENTAIWGQRMLDSADEAKRLLLSEFNLSQVDFYRANLEHAELRRADLSEAKLVHANLNSSKLQGATLHGAQLWGVRLQRADLTRARMGRTNLVDIDFSETCLDGINFSGQNLSGAKFINSHLRGVDLRDANLTGARLKGADLRNADLTGATLTNSLWTEANVAGIKYNRQLLSGRCGSIGGVAEMYGMPLFRRDVMDQDYLDTLHKQLQLQRPRAEWLWGFEWRAKARRPGWFRFLDAVMAVMGGFPREFRSPLKPLPEIRQKAAEETKTKAQKVYGINTAIIRGRGLLSALWSGRHRLAGSLVKLSALFGGIVGAMLPVIITGQWNWHEWLIYGFIIGYLIGAFSSSWAFHRLGYWLWQWMDYGRDWQGVFIAGVVVISLVGLGYQFTDGSHVHLHYPADAGGDDMLNHWFYPWFVAAMGFATLGIADLAEPLTGLGMLLMITNVLAGFFTLGLLLSVLANIFARRA